jgi:hypothetical protein
MDIVQLFEMIEVARDQGVRRIGTFEFREHRVHGASIRESCERVVSAPNGELRSPFDGCGLALSTKIGSEFSVDIGFRYENLNDKLMEIPTMLRLTTFRTRPVAVATT